MEKFIKIFVIIFIVTSCSARSIYIDKIETYPSFYKIYFKENDKKGFFISTKNQCEYFKTKDSIIAGKKMNIRKDAIWWEDPKAVMYQDEILIWDSKSEYMMYNTNGFCGLHTIKVEKTKVVRKKDLLELLK
ncbi:hypothetical protein [Chryseobacterium sp. JM1]|uniref:hypothetical protein n=1 Tax=Chryseobacterium sp. JM1 TaxID=1233950 RepID=UPI0004E77F02|nr:hypothetical protein [Chryseobacterium sp. JM1]KFF16464.1 hypothetical protein IW22_22750 [Chryseobacterium sp. JM1]